MANYFRFKAGDKVRLRARPTSTTGLKEHDKEFATITERTNFGYYYNIREPYIDGSWRDGCFDPVDLEALSAKAPRTAIKRARQKAGLTLREVEERTGLYDTILANYEEGVWKAEDLPLRTAVMLARLYGCDANDLI